MLFVPAAQHLEGDSAAQLLVGAAPDDPDTAEADRVVHLVFAEARLARWLEQGLGVAYSGRSRTRSGASLLISLTPPVCVGVLCRRPAPSHRCAHRGRVLRMRGAQGLELAIARSGGAAAALSRSPSAAAIASGSALTGLTIAAGS